MNWIQKLTNDLQERYYSIGYHDRLRGVDIDKGKENIDPDWTDHYANGWYDADIAMAQVMRQEAT